MRTFGGTRGFALLWLALATGAGAQESLTARTVEPQVYAVSVNGRQAGDTVLLKVDGERLLARDADWQRWQLLRPGTRYQYDGEAWYELGEAPGFKATLDPQKLEARLEFAAQAFAPSTLRVRRYDRVPPTPPPGPGGFLNYELFATHRVPDGAAASSELSGLVETGAFNRHGVLTSAWVGQNLTGEDAPAVGVAGEARVVRLETTLTRDFPDEMETLRLGDAVGAAGLWGRPVRFGGARWTRNFATQPGFITLPQPALRGETALPSVLDVYVDGMRRESLEVPPGPFVVEELPVISGLGEVQVVVRDLLGREQVITDSYITGTQLLRRGLHDWSYEGGFVRENFGRVSDDYGDAFVAATHRYGFADTFTGEARVEAGDDLVAAGLGGALAIPGVAVVSNAFAVSHSDAGDGALDVLSIQHSSRRGLSAGARFQAASANFRQLGLAPGFGVPRRSFGANLGYALRPLGRFGLGYVSRDEAAPLQDFEAVNATFSTGFRRVNVTLLAIDRKRPTPEWSVGLNIGMLFGTTESGALGHRHREADAGGSSSQSYARLQRGLSEQEGWGYRVQVGQDRSDVADDAVSAEAGVGVNARYGSYGLEAATYGEIETYRATVSGGLGTVGGHTFASRKLARSFAVVETGAEGVDLMVNNRLAGRTDADGVAVLPYLQPYQTNVVRIDATNVPLDVEVQEGEFKAAPYFRSGMVIPLDVRQTRSAVLTLLQADGTAVPPGAVARHATTGAEAPVARQGKVFLSGLSPGDNALDVRWNGQRCRIAFNLPADAGVQPQLGPYTCQ